MRASITRLASATICSMLLFSRLTGLFGHGLIEPGEKIDALQPFPTGQTSILYPYSHLLSLFALHKRAETALQYRPDDGGAGSIRCASTNLVGIIWPDMRGYSLTPLESLAIRVGFKFSSMNINSEG